MDITIRTALETDYEEILALFRDFAAFEKLPEKMTNSVARMKEEEEFFNCIVAETAKGEIVGYAAYFYCYYTWTGKSLFMDDLYVKPEVRGASIGTKLLNSVIQIAKTSNCHKLRWQVSQWNKPAIEFYKKIGATIDDVEQNCDLVLS